MVANFHLNISWKRKGILLLCGALLTSCTSFSPQTIAAEPQQQSAEPQLQSESQPTAIAIPTPTHNLQTPSLVENTSSLEANGGVYEPINFLEACENGGYVGWETLHSLLDEVGTDDCELAQTRLLQITDLRLSGPDMTEAVITCLLIDFSDPTVDIGMIAAAMPNLTRLELNGKVIQNLTPIANLTQLTELHLSNTQLSDISPIANLTQLTTLDISHNQVHDISPMSELSNLQHINLAANPVRDISPLAVLPYEGSSFNLSDVDFDLETCPDVLGDACEDPAIGYQEGLY